MPAQSPAEMLRAARALLEQLYGPASGSISILIRDGAGKRLALSLPIADLTIPEPATPMQADILEALVGGVSVRGRELATRSGYRWGSHFRETLAAMRKAGLLVSTEEGYRLASETEADQDRHGG